MSLIYELKTAFAKAFGAEVSPRVFFAPGRVNLIGEHTDYNGGHVFPCALTIGTYGLARRRRDRKVRMYSVNFESVGVVEADLDMLGNDLKGTWTNYVTGVIRTCMEAGYEIPCGMDFLCYGTIPNKSGLSSSASLEVLVCRVLSGLFGLDIDGVTAAKLSQKAENEFVGVACGIMDQFAIAMGRKNRAIFLDTATMDYSYAALPMDGYKIVIGNTNKARGLADSKYNERRSECEAALADLQTIYPEIKALGELDEQQLDLAAYAIKNPTHMRRARHAVWENQRTLRAVDALKKKDLVLFGKLMNASHVSLRDDYEVTGKELDTLVSAAWAQPGVIGARMTGAGFGGCTVSIVRANQAEAFIRNVGAAYEKAIGYAADFYVVEIGDGPRELMD